jgi:hypothetical protein
MLPPVSFTLVFHIGLLIQILRLRHLWQGVHCDQLKVMVPQHLIVACVIIDTCFDIKFAYVHRHRDVLLLRESVYRAWGFSGTT